MAKLKLYEVKNEIFLHETNTADCFDNLETVYRCVIPDWDKRGVKHVLYASSFYDVEDDSPSCRFIIHYFEGEPDARVIDLSLYGLNAQKIQDELAIVFKNTAFTIHPRMLSITAEMLETARKKILANLRS